MNGSTIENSCITKYVYQDFNKIINQSINQSIKASLLLAGYYLCEIYYTVVEEMEWGI